MNFAEGDRLTFNTSYYEKLHKWPRGFKKRLCDFYNLKNKEIFNYKGHQTIYRCAFCGSTNQVSIHHYSEHHEKRAQYLNLDILEVDFKDFSKYIPLCRSCHSTIHAQLGETCSKGYSPLLQAFQNYMEKIHGEKAYWHSDE
jgi:hypothetical protein